MAAGVWQHAIRLMSKLSSLLTKAKSRQPDELIVPLGVLIGTVAFELWWQSFAASLLALIVLCFLAGIYKTNQSCWLHSESPRVYRSLETQTPARSPGPTQRTVLPSTRRSDR